MRHLNPSLPDKKSSKGVQIKPLEYYVHGITKNRDRFILSEAITLLESNNKNHKDLAYQILDACHNQDINTRRIAITGSPGVGKSTFIEVYGQSLIQDKRRVAILTVDPSSPLTHGSILGDKTRMQKLSSQPDLFIRPSPSSNHLGGAHRYSYEAIKLCEAAGYQDILIETVGVGQSEIEVTNFVDMVILLILPGSGDGLQAIKKGIMETVDLIVVHKADGVRKELAKEMIQSINEALHNQTSTMTPIMMHSSLNDNLPILPKKHIQHYFKDQRKQIDLRRIFQDKKWLAKRLSQLVLDEVTQIITPKIQKILDSSTVNSDSIFAQYLRLSKTIQISADIGQ